MNARKVLDDNNIAMEKAGHVVEEVSVKTRSVSLVGNPNNTIDSRRKHVERSKSVVEVAGDIPDKDNEVRRKSKKCDIFDTISEQESKSEESPLGTSCVDVMKMGREKSSKKVSIAENLNCDYSDSNNSDFNDSDNDAVEVNHGSHNSFYGIKYLLVSIYDINEPGIYFLLILFILFYFYFVL